MINDLGYSLKQAFIQMWRNRGMILASFFAITAMLLILGLFFFLTVNVNYMTESVKGQFDSIEVFLEDDTTRSEANEMIKSLKDLPDVESASYISKAEAMEEFKERWGENAYLLDEVDLDYLPNSVRVKLKNLEGGELIASICRNFIGVEDVRYYQTEIDKIVSFSSAIQKGALIVILFLIAVSVVVVSNTIKLTVMARKYEIMIMKYVGATNWFIRGPMFLEGMLIGLISGLIAILICHILYGKFYAAIGTQAAVLFSFKLVDPAFMTMNLAAIFGALGISIGAAGSIISMRRYLKEA